MILYMYDLRFIAEIVLVLVNVSYSVSSVC